MYEEDEEVRKKVFIKVGISILILLITTIIGIILFVNR